MTVWARCGGLPYRDCHEPSVLAMTICVGEIAMAFSKPRNDSFIIAMTVWVGFDGCHTEIATSSTNSRNDKPRIMRLP